MINLKRLIAIKSFIPKNNIFNVYKSTTYMQKMTDKLYYQFAKNVVNVPSLGDSITEGSIFEFKKNTGDFIDRDEVVVLIETDKVQVEIRSPFSGVLTQKFAQNGETVLVQKPLFEIDTDVKASEQHLKPAQQQQKPQKVEQPQKPQKVQQPPQQTQQQIQQPQPPQVQQQQVQQQPQQVYTEQQNLETSTEAKNNRNERRVPMNKMRQTIAQRLKESQNTYAQLTTFQECDMSAIMDLRKKVGEEFLKKHKVKLGFMSFFVKAVVSSLKEQPSVNAIIDGKDIVYRDYYDISVAVATPTGLMVPVLRNCESKSFAEIEKNLAELAEKGKNGKITIQEMAGGTFSISNGGVFGSLMGTPIINMPQSAILGMHAIVNRPVVRLDKIVARPMMYIVLTYDHRLIDGREAGKFIQTIYSTALFLKHLANCIEDPSKLLLEI